MSPRLRAGGTVLMVELGPWHQDVVLAHALSVDGPATLVCRAPELADLLPHDAPVQACVRPRPWTLLGMSRAADRIYLNTCERPKPLLYFLFCRYVLRKDVYVCAHNLDFFRTELSGRGLKRRLFAMVAQAAIPAKRIQVLSPFVAGVFEATTGIRPRLLAVRGLARIAAPATRERVSVVGGIYSHRKNVPLLYAIDYQRIARAGLSFCVAGDIRAAQGPAFRSFLRAQGVPAETFEGFLPWSAFFDVCAGSRVLLAVYPSDAYETIKSSAAMFIARAFGRSLVMAWDGRAAVYGAQTTWYPDVNAAIAAVLDAECSDRGTAEDR